MTLLTRIRYWLLPQIETLSTAPTVEAQARWKQAAAHLEIMELHLRRARRAYNQAVRAENDARCLLEIWRERQRSEQL